MYRYFNFISQIISKFIFLLFPVQGEQLHHDWLDRENNKIVARIRLEPIKVPSA
jgi:hypothetical protein